MDASAWGLLGLFLALLGLLAWPLGRLLAALIAGSMPRWMLRVEALLYRLAGVRSDAPMGWRTYAMSLLAFNALGESLRVVLDPTMKDR